MIHGKSFLFVSDRSFAVAPTEDDNNDDATTPTSKGKEKAKAKHIGARVRVFFPGFDNYFNGTVGAENGEGFTRVRSSGLGL